MLKFQFDSVADFISMSGHGPYVWACYAITAVCLIYLAVAPVVQRRAILAEVRRQAKLAQRDGQQRTDISAG